MLRTIHGLYHQPPWNTTRLSNQPWSAPPPAAAPSPHAWPHSSFHRLVAGERYRAEWCCQCEGEAFEEPPEFQAIARLAGE